MARCLSCNKNLNDRESTRRYASTGSFLDLCDGCFAPIAADVAVVEGRAFKNKSTDHLDEFDADADNV